MPERSPFVATALLLSAALSPALLADPSATDTARWARLESGEVIARDFSPEGGIWPGPGTDSGAVRMQMLVQAPASAVWAVIVSCDQAFLFIDGLRECEVLEDLGGRVRVRQVVDQGWLAPRLEFVFESRREPYRRIDVSLLEGNLDVLEGRWLFEETPRGTLVDHALHIRPQVPLPRFLVRRNIEGSMPDMLACVRALAGGSGSAQRREEDLARCRGPGTAGR